MNIILLSGGSGKRLWPLSNEIRSKQFLKLFKNEKGEHESMVQRVYRQLRTVDRDCTVTIATSKKQVSSIHNQLDERVGISVEPCRRDTFPAIVLTTAYLHDVQKVNENETVVVLPVDPYVQNEYFYMLKRLGEQAATGEANIVLMGIEPTYPSEKYGYIIPTDTSEVSGVKMFKEKPDQKTAKDYIANGALWNGGVFAYKIGYLLDTAEKLLGTSKYAELFSNYDNLPQISFDYAVVEKEEKIQVMRFSGEWIDLGSWNTLTDTMSENIIGDAIEDDVCENVHIINELDVPILAMGLKNVVISASPDGILVSDKDQSGYMKKYVEHMNRKAMFAEKSWGAFKVIDTSSNSMTIKVTIKAGDSMNYHSHEHRDEVWVIVSGEGRTIIDGMEQKVYTGDVVTMKAGCRHTIFAETALEIIEVQLGKEININDKQKFPLE